MAFGGWDCDGRDDFTIDKITYDAQGNINSLKRRNESGGWLDNLAYIHTANTNRLNRITGLGNITGLGSKKV